ncbi:ribonuclease P protein subunit p20 [Zophobas morio]|uniref:ribonuclease P protein subunit p20 n=1 Tax=Zophobas morio TaxID=2755281 RepID=UPI003082D192
MEGSSSANDPKPKKPTKQPRAPSKDHVLRKRRPQKPERDASVVYVNTKTPIKAVVDRCCKLINKGEKELTLYCLGAAIQRGILIALRLCEQNVAYKIHSNTFTTELIDDLEPATDDADYTIQRRSNSALKIRVFRSDPLKP